MNTTLKQVLRGLALVAALTGGAQADTLTLEELFSGGSLTAGDKRFDQFFLVIQGPQGGPLPASSDGRAFDASKINVETLTDNGSGFGLAFSITDAQLNVVGDGIYAFADYSFGFRVTATDPGQRIVGAAMDFAAGGASLVNAADGFNDLGVYIKESIGSKAEGSDINDDLFVQFSSLDDMLTGVNPSSVSFGPVESLWVTKNILVWSTDETDNASLTGFSQRFKQAPVAVPEPASYALVGVALLAAGTASRRRKGLNA